MKKVKQRKVGASYVVTVPSEMVQETEVEYEVKQLADGGLLYTPIHEDESERQKLVQKLSAEVKERRKAIEQGKFVTHDELEKMFDL